MLFKKEDLPKIKEGVKSSLPNVEGLLTTLDQKPDIDPRVKTLLKIRFIIPAIRDHEEAIKYLGQLIDDEDEEITSFELIHAAFQKANSGNQIIQNIITDIEDSLVIEFIRIPDDINKQVEEVLTRFSSEDRQRFSLQ